jgi:phospholipid/cholesterol/gamma-HCH transport system permease protein
MVSFTLNVLLRTFLPPFYPRIILQHAVEIGFFSLPVVGLTAFFAGMVLALQGHTGFARFSAEAAVPRIVALTLTRELGPVLTGLIVAGRMSSAIAAEIASMKVTEQINALITLSIKPLHYLVVPRVIAAVIVLPILVSISDIIGIMGGTLISVYQLDFHPDTYLQNTWNFIEPLDVISGLVKASAFGFLIAIMGCYQGLRCEEGAQGVGRATTLAVVAASVSILFANFILTSLFF